jgi:hypothetical protein
VQTDVREGLARVNELRGQYPVSMVLEGSAFEEIYPPDEKRRAVCFSIIFTPCLGLPSPHSCDFE